MTTKTTLLASLMLASGLPAIAQHDTINPLRGDLRVHDPVMIKEGSTYHVYATGYGIGAKTSTDRVTWFRDSGVFSRSDMPAWFVTEVPEHKGFIWAPDIHYRDGLYHMYYSVSAWMNFKSSIGYATNTTLDRTDPHYKWVDHGLVISYRNGGQGVNVIDPNVFVDKDGKVWLLYGSYQAGLRLVELDRKTGKLKSETPEVHVITTALGEGAFIIRGPEYYYIFASRGRCCAGVQSTYQVVMGRSKTVTGPYLNRQGESWLDNKYSVFLAGDSSAPGKGHNGFFTEHDTTFVVYHAYTRAANGASLLNIRPLYVDDQGWPSMDAHHPLFRRKLFDDK